MTMTKEVCTHDDLKGDYAYLYTSRVRFRFPQGLNGPVVDQAHNDHFVGRSGNGFRADVGS